MDDDALLDAWLAELRASGYRKRTLESYEWALRALLRRTGKHMLDMTRQDLIRDLGRQEIQNSTRQHQKSLCHLVWTWLQDEGYRLDNPAVRLPKVRVVLPEANPVTTEDLQILISSGIYSRTRMYVLLYAYQGYRASEIAAVSGEAIDWNRRRILSREAKGGKEVWRPIHPLVWAEAQKYPRSGYWFPSPYVAGPIGGGNVSAVLSQAMKRAGIVGHRPHNLRAWYATEQNRVGVPTATIAAGMRHSDLQSIPRYTAVQEAEIAAAQEQLPDIIVPTRTPRAAVRGPYKPRAQAAPVITSAGSPESAVTEAPTEARLAA